MAVPLIPLVIAATAAGGAGTFGYFLVSTYEGKILSKVRDRNKSAYPEWPSDAFGYSDEVLLNALGKLRQLVIKKNVNVDDKKQLHAAAKTIMKEMKIPLEINNITRFSAMLRTVVDEIKQTDDDLYSYLRGGLTDRDRLKQRAQEITSTYEAITPKILQPDKIIKYALIGGAAYLLFVYGLPVAKKLMNRKK